MTSQFPRRGTIENRNYQPSTIERAGYIALRSTDPGAAATFAVERMGLHLVHVDEAGRYYLAGTGLDPYSLVYTPGEAKGIDHIAYLVRDLATLNQMQVRLESEGVAVERLDPHEFWRSGPALRVYSPAGHAVHVTTGVYVSVPMGASVQPHQAPPAPISFDHAAPRIADPEAEMKFCAEVLGLKESARIVHPENGIAISFFRAHTLFHCYTIVTGPKNGLHHFQFTFKDRFAVLDAYERLREHGDVELVWGPLRHGPGHNVAFYFFDNDKNIVEYSAEEEIILDPGGYIASEWSALDPAFTDEWGSTPPEIFFA